MRRVHVAGGHLVQQRVGVLVQPERRLPLDRGVQRGAEGEHVRGGRRLLPAGHLGGQEGRRAGDQPGAGELHLVDRAGDAEVGQLDQAVVGDEHVARLDVAVHDTRGVRGGQPVGDLAPDLRDLARRQRALSPSMPASDWDGRYSITSHGRSSCTTTSNMLITCGCCSRAPIRPSRRIRCRDSSSASPPAAVGGSAAAAAP